MIDPDPALWQYCPIAYLNLHCPTTTYFWRTFLKDEIYPCLQNAEKNFFDARKSRILEKGPEYMLVESNNLNR